jgi:hypothetical protein
MNVTADLNVFENLGVEELDEFSPSPGLFSDLSVFTKGLFALFGNFFG